MKHILILMLMGVFCRSVQAQEARPRIRKVAVAEYRTGYLYDDGSFWSFENTRMIRYEAGGRKIVDVCSGFNLLLALDDEGYVWTTRLGIPRLFRIDTDSSGAPFNGNKAIFGYANGHTSIRGDGSLWYWGDDTFHLAHQTGRVWIRPIRISPPGMKVRKVVMGYFRIVVLTGNGEVWEWDRGKGRKPVRKVLPRKAVDIFASHWDYAGCIVPDAHGSRTMGYPYIWGSTYGFWGGTAMAAEPTPLKKLWKLTVPIRTIVASYNTIHFIDSLGRLFGIGDNAMGEIGNGEELVNQYTYPAPYSWTFNKDEDLTGAPPIQIGKGIRWKTLFADNFLAFYTYAVDEEGKLYFWGRDKALASGRGWLNLDEAKYPNALDVLEPTVVEPSKAVFQAYHFKLPGLRVGSDTTIRGTSVTLYSDVHPAMLVRASLRALNGVDTIRYPIQEYQWKVVRGAGAKIADAQAASTEVTGLRPGIYEFNLKTTDSNGGTLSGDVRVTVQ
ncbi:MAG TPA: hypothetical protein VG605_23695 [Puia sp.]|nr:hypothetical protein [Puia sp.]